jgi:hypothetical protein
MERVSANLQKMATPLGGASLAAILTALYLFSKQQSIYIGLGLGAGLLIYALSKRNLLGAIVGGCVVALVAGERHRLEGFDSENVIEKAMASVQKKDPALASFEKEAPAAKAPPPPDNGSRGEFFELGKKYKLPSETDDKGFHLDAGTTFMNAYKSLKPDQIAAMTKDTQELLDTQKQLMATLNTLKPLMQDGKDMMNTFQSYFGAGASNNTA